VNSASRLKAAAFAAAIALCAPPSWGLEGTPSNLTGAVSAEGDLAERVRSALQAAPYLYDRHIDVSVRDGQVVLTGFVFSDWDLHDALRIASDAAKPHRVIDDLYIEEGGRR
jgi:osmotically-inducible protein OsmY